MKVSRRDILKGAAAAGVAAGLPVNARWEEAAQDQGPKPSTRVRKFEELAYGMFYVWGLYSQMAQGEWVETMHKIPKNEYLKLMNTFTAEDFDAKEIARVAKRAGMKYVTLTARHHDGFSLYDTRGLSKLDITNTPAKGRDLIAEYTSTLRDEGIVPMIYHTTLDWNDERFKADFNAYLDYLHACIELLCRNYGEVGGFWFDGNWAKPDADWKLDRLYGIIREHQPEAMIINNTGISAMGEVEHPEIDSVTYERGRPEPLDRTNHKKYITGEMCHTLNFHWGNAERDFNYLSPAHVIEELCASRRAGANLLLNLAPEHHGRLPDYESALAARVGDWIRAHGDLIYRGKPGILGEDGDSGLMLDDELYLFVTQISATASTYAHGPKVRGPGPRKFTKVPGTWSSAEWMDSGEDLKLEQDSESLTLHATDYPYGTNMVVRVAKLSR
jgi:alpha-L-fucosidase